MNPLALGKWATAAYRSSFIQILITGDDSVAFFPDGTALDADISACDQSLTQSWYDAFKDYANQKGIDASPLDDIWNQEYKSILPPYVEKHNNSGACYTSIFTYFAVATTYMLAFMRKRNDPFELSLQKSAEKLGMKWSGLDRGRKPYTDVVFMKGCWCRIN